MSMWDLQLRSDQYFHVKSDPVLNQFQLLCSFQGAKTWPSVAQRGEKIFKKCSLHKGSCNSGRRAKDQMVGSSTPVLS